MRSLKSQGGLINITHNDSAQKKWLLSSHIVANHTDALQDLAGVITGTWSEQHHDVQASRRKENICHLRNFIDFFDIDIPVNKHINIATGVIASHDINVDLAIDIGTKIVSGLDNKKLCEISLIKDRAKTFAAMRKFVKFGETVIQMSFDQLSQRLLASVVPDQAPSLEIFSYELSGVAPSLFYDNAEMKKNKKAELMNAVSTILNGVLTELDFHIIDGCAWLY